jgi:hypothetical protein
MYILIAPDIKEQVNYAIHEWRALSGVLAWGKGHVKIIVLDKIL